LEITPGKTLLTILCIAGADIAVMNPGAVAAAVSIIATSASKTAHKIKQSFILQEKENTDSSDHQ
jgi:hypothetical protein